MNTFSRHNLLMKMRKRKKLVIIIVCIAVAAVITIWIALSANRQSETSIFTDGTQTVTLRDDGTFTAKLADSNTIKGEYSETAVDGVIMVFFNHGAAPVIGRIEDDALVLPDEWDGGHDVRLLQNSGWQRNINDFPDEDYDFE